MVEDPDALAALLDSLARSDPLQVHGTEPLASWTATPDQQTASELHDKS